MACPQLGEIRRAKELGLKGSYAYSWDACLTCGKPRWIVIKGGRPQSKRCHSCANKDKHPGRGSLNPNWRGGRHQQTDGYVIMSLPKESPYRCMVDDQGRVREHRVVMAESLGRPLKTWEIVHHLNGNRADNKIENLQLLPNAAEHCAMTRIQQYITSLENKIKELSTRLIKYEEVN